MSKNCMIFAPHQDDACLGCGGIIVQKIKNKENVVVVDVTDGRNCFFLCFHTTHNPTPEETAGIRKTEEIQVMHHLGVPQENIMFLGYEDGLLYKKKKEAEKKFLELIQTIQPSEVFIPAIEEKHQDHMLTNMLVNECLWELHLDIPVYEYFIWARPHIEKLSQKNLVKIDIRDSLHQKKTAIQFYKSQVAMFAANQQHPVLDPTFLNYFYTNEEFFRVSQKPTRMSRLTYFITLLKLRYTIFYINGLRI